MGQIEVEGFAGTYGTDVTDNSRKHKEDGAAKRQLKVEFRVRATRRFSTCFYNIT